jgi:hypothetical protein
MTTIRSSARSRHRPQKRTTQYSRVTTESHMCDNVYWMPAFAGMTAERVSH